MNIPSILISTVITLFNITTMTDIIIVVCVSNIVFIIIC